jgi:ribosome-associated protein
VIGEPAAAAGLREQPGRDLDHEAERGDDQHVADDRGHLGGHDEERERREEREPVPHAVIVRWFAMEREVRIRGDMIRLGQLLKLAGLIDSSGEAKAFLAAVDVTVNGEPEARRGRQLHPGDEVVAGGETLRVVA